MSQVQTVVTAAGSSLKSFLTAGFSSPKSLVAVDGQPLLIAATKSYSVSLGETVVAINREEDVNFGISEMIKNHLPMVQIYSSPDRGHGALITAMCALEGLDPSGPLAIASGDSTYKGQISTAVETIRDSGAKAGTLAFPSTSPRWSYLRLDKTGDVIEVAEKRVVGPYATTGFFYFESVNLFLEAAKWVLVNNVNHEGKFFVSATLNYLVSLGEKVAVQLAQPSDYRSYSVPYDFIEESR